MFLALGIGAFAAGVFHVFTHAFFKALLFLGAGSVIHALGGEQDMRKMGALAHKIPRTYRTMFIATLAIAGIPAMASVAINMVRYVRGILCARAPILRMSCSPPRA